MKGTEPLTGVAPASSSLGGVDLTTTSLALSPAGSASRW